MTKEAAMGRTCSSDGE